MPVKATHLELTQGDSSTYLLQPNKRYQGSFVSRLDVEALLAGPCRSTGGCDGGRGPASTDAALQPRGCCVLDRGGLFGQQVGVVHLSTA